MDLREDIRTLIRAGILAPKRALGQHFIVDHEFLTRMVNYAQVSDNDIVLEIGAGVGFLTNLLAKKAKLVYAVELDHRLAAYLRSRFPENFNVKVIEGNFLKTKIEGFNKVVSNPPYAISTPMMLKLVEAGPELMVLTLQEEFSRKLYAKPGSSSYGRLTVLMALNYDVEILERVPGRLFYPKSKVRSVLVRLKRRCQALDSKQLRAVRKVVDKAFSLRNKTLNKFVRSILSDAVLQYDPRMRVYQTDPRIFLEIAEHLLKRARLNV